MICPPEHKHGETSTCYTRHDCRCGRCREWNKEYHYMRRHLIALGRSMPHGHIDATPTIRRIEALACLGWSMPAIGAAAGHAKVGDITRATTVRRSTAAAIDRAYEALSMRLPEARTRWQLAAINKTKSQARQRGWFPPLAYDDIDNLAETPRERKDAA